MESEPALIGVAREEWGLRDRPALIRAHRPSDPVGGLLHQSGGQIREHCAEPASGRSDVAVSLHPLPIESVFLREALITLSEGCIDLLLLVARDGRNSHSEPIREGQSE